MGKGLFSHVAGWQPCGRMEVGEGCARVSHQPHSANPALGVPPTAQLTTTLRARHRHTNYLQYPLTHQLPFRLLFNTCSCSLSTFSRGSVEKWLNNWSRPHQRQQCHQIALALPERNCQNVLRNTVLIIMRRYFLLPERGRRSHLIYSTIVTAPFFRMRPTVKTPQSATSAFVSSPKMFLIPPQPLHFPCCCLVSIHNQVRSSVGRRF